MSQALTILFSSVDADGHLSAMVGIAQQLHSRGHKVVFVTPERWKGKLEALGFVEEYFHEEITKYETKKYFKKMGPVFAMAPIQKMERLHVPLFKLMVQTAKSHYPYFKEIVANVKPDVVVLDMLMQNPTVVDLSKKSFLWALNVKLHLQVNK